MRTMLAPPEVREETIRRLLRGVTARRWLLDLARAGGTRRDRGRAALVRRLNRVLAREPHETTGTRDA